MNNDNNNKTFVGLAIGLFAGAAAGYYLASDDGKKMRKQAKKQAKKLELQAKTALKEQSDVLSAKIDEVTNNAKSLVNEATETAKSKFASYRHEAEDVVDEVEGSFQKGISSAKAKIAAKTNRVPTVTIK